MSSKDSSSLQSHSRRPANTPFKQQRLKAWQPILTPKPVIISFIIIGIVFIPIGVGIVISSNQVVEVDVQYDNRCPIGTLCSVELHVPKKMEKPVYLYYRLDDFYQNHRRYVQSRNDDQLRGQLPTSYSDITDCEPFAAVGDEIPQNFYLPCGLIARSQFNDTFSLWSPSQEPIPLRRNGIAWASDREKKFKNPPKGSLGIRVIPDFEDEDFIVWMRTAGLPDFKKLYRIIDIDLEPGVYTVNITSNFPVASFNGKKHVVLSTTTWIGGKNPFLGYAYIVVGAICFVQGIVFLLKHRFSPRKLGDTKYLEWNK